MMVIIHREENAAETKYSLWQPVAQWGLTNYSTPLASPKHAQQITKLESFWDGVWCAWDDI